MRELSAAGHDIWEEESVNLFDYVGVIHIHSEMSFDGSTPVADIIAAAEENRMDFLMLTDHDHLLARERGWEGWHGNTLLIVGQEITPRFNHYLAFQIERAVEVPKDAPEYPPQAYIDQVSEMGGIGIIAHPDHRGAAKFHVKHYPWLDWGVEKYNGIGIWDFMTDWQESLSGYPQAMVCYLFPFLFLRGPKVETLRRWDQLNQGRQVVGIGECDNHNTKRKVFGFNLEVFPFRKAFKYLRTHILLESPLMKDKERDIGAMYDAVRRGRVYVAHDYLGSATGFSFTLSDGRRFYTMGDVCTSRETMEITVELPAIAKVRVIADGRPIYEAYTQRCSLEVTDPGVYRVEAYKKAWCRFRPWIFSNPIYIRGN